MSDPESTGVSLVEPVAIAAPAPVTPPTSIRFDAESDAFEEIAAEYRRALARAERLWKRLERAEEEGEFSKSKKLGRKLAKVEEELDAARERLMEHVARTTRHEKRSRRRRWSLRHERLRVSAVA